MQDRLLRTGEWRGELRHRRRDGTAVVVAAHWILRRDTATGAPATVIELHADATALKAAEAALRAGEARLRLAQEVAGIGTWEWDPEEDRLVASAEQHALFGTSPAAGAPATLDAFLELVHPEDRAAVRRAFSRALEDGEYEVEFRIFRPCRNGVPSDDMRWMIGRGRRMPGLAGHLGPILGVHVDITARKEAEECQALLMREVDHRAKNALAVVQAVLRLTRADSPGAFARAVEGRVAALARAQTVLAESHWVGADLGTILKGELAPFIGAVADGSERVVLEGPALAIAPFMAQPLSMALHELATNAAKYGALSRPEGRLSVTWSVDRAAEGGGGRLSLRWIEIGGPAIPGPPNQRGFGSRVVETTIREQLGGRVTPHWLPEGLRCEFEVPLVRTLAGRPPVVTATAA